MVDTITKSSNDWFKIHVDRKELKKLCKRSDLAGFKHIVIYFVSLIGLGLLCINYYETWWFILFYICYCTLWEEQMPYGMNVGMELHLRQENTMTFLLHSKFYE